MRGMSPFAPRTTARIAIAVALLLAGLSATAAALTRASTAGASLRGSKASIAKMYYFAVRHDIAFANTSDDVDAAIARGRLVPLPGSAFYEVSAAVTFPYASPEARAFVEALAPSFVKTCGFPMVVTSATRPESRQPRNAAELSVHPTGIAVDLRKPYPGPCLSWLRDTLMTLEATGRIEVTEERHPPHFHVAVLAQPGSAPIPGLIARLLAPEESATIKLSSAIGSGFPVLEQRSEPLLAFGPLFHAPLLPSEVLATLTGDEVLPVPADLTVAGVSAGDVEVPTPDSAAADSAGTAPAKAKVAAKPRASTYIVRSGDTLWDIARKHGLSVGELQRANHLGKRSRIKPKMKLTIPD